MDDRTKEYDEKTRQPTTARDFIMVDGMPLYRLRGPITYMIPADDEEEEEHNPPDISEPINEQ